MSPGGLQHRSCPCFFPPFFPHVCVGCSVHAPLSSWSTFPAFTIIQARAPQQPGWYSLPLRRCDFTSSHTRQSRAGDMANDCLGAAPPAGGHKRSPLDRLT